MEDANAAVQILLSIRPMDAAKQKDAAVRTLVSIHKWKPHEFQPRAGNCSAFTRPNGCHADSLGQLRYATKCYRVLKPEQEPKDVPLTLGQSKHRDQEQNVAAQETQEGLVKLQGKYPTSTMSPADFFYFRKTIASCQNRIKPY